MPRLPRDFADKCNRFEKKLHDLELTKMISMQTAPQIRLIQSNDTNMVEKIQTTIVNTIPLWKSQMVLALGIAHSTEAAKAQQAVTNLTNDLLKQNAEALHTASVETARESERGIVDIETLKKTNENLIRTLDDVLKIQEDGRAKRRAAEEEMARMEQELKNKLLEIHRAISPGYQISVQGPSVRFAHGGLHLSQRGDKHVQRSYQNNQDRGRKIGGGIRSGSSP